MAVSKSAMACKVTRSWADEGLHQERMGGDDACIGGQGRGALMAWMTLCDDIGRAHVVRTEEGFQGGTARELRRFEGRPATQEVAKDRGVFLLKPVQHVRERVLQGTGEAVGDPHFVADHAATVFDELCEGAHRGALRLERLQLVAMGEQQFELECGIGGVVFGPAGGEGFAIPRQRQGIDGKEHQKVIRAQGGDNGAFVEFQADGNGLAVEPRAQRLTHASIASGVCSSCRHSRSAEPAAWRQTSCLASAQSRPTKAANASGAMCSCVHLPACARVVRRDMPADVLRRHYREPVTRQTLSIR